MPENVVRVVEYAYTDVYANLLYISRVVASRTNNFVFPLSLIKVTRSTAYRFVILSITVAVIDDSSIISSTFNCPITIIFLYVALCDVMG